MIGPNAITPAAGALLASIRAELNPLKSDLPVSQPDFLSKFQQPIRRGDQWSAKCPAHADNKASLSIRRGDGKWLVYCHAGCTLDAICQAAGIEVRDLFDVFPEASSSTSGTSVKPRIAGTYDYTDEQGKLLYQILRYEPKDFRARTPDGHGGWVPNISHVRQVLYNLPEVVTANEVIVCEGEKDVTSANVWGLVGTCNAFGAGKWREEYSESLRGKHVTIVADADRAGRAHAQQVAESLYGKAASIKVIEMPGAKDLTEWFEKDGTRDKTQLLKLINDAPEWAPATEVSQSVIEVLPPASEIEVRETDLGNALRFVERHGGDVRHCAALGWLVWDGQRWKQQGEESTKPVVELMKETVNAIFQEIDATTDLDKAKHLCAWALQSQSNARIKSALSLAESDPRISIVANQLDRHPMLLNVENGTLDLQTFELRPHDKADYITKLCSVSYDPGATHVEFDKFITRILPDPEVRAFIQRWFGYCLTGSVGEQKFVIAHGSGANGKSQLLEVFRNLLGEDQYAKRSKFDTFRDGRHGETRNDIACFKGMRLVTASEGDENMRLDESMIKDLTGGEGITARFLYHEFFTFTPEFKITLSTNYKPAIYGQDHAIWRRVCLVPFEVQIPAEEQEKDIHARLLQEEPSGILNWALNGLREQQQVGLNPPAKVKAATEDYRAEQDTIGQFLEERCERGIGFETQSRDLHGAYTAWAVGAGYHPLSLKSFNMRIAARGFDGGDRNEHGKLWRGLRLRRTM